MQENQELVRKSYANSETDVRIKFGEDALSAREYYRRYTQFILKSLSPGQNQILDVGCGEGWSTFVLKQAGMNVIGMDLHQHAPEAQSADPELTYVQGSILKIPFPNDSFDLVSMHAVLEHIPDVDLALQEIKRVLKKDGKIIVVGPNLLSFPFAFYWFVRKTFSNWRRGIFWLKRTTEMPMHPAGNVPSELALSSLRYIRLTLAKLFFEDRPIFHYRTPDHRPPFHADSDACYLCNPMDLLNWGKTNGFKPLQWWSSDRKGARVLWPLGGGTWVVMQKVVPELTSAG